MDFFYFIYVGIETITLSLQYIMFALGSRVGVDLRLVCFSSFTDVVVFEVSVSRGTVPFLPMGLCTASEDTANHPRGRFAWTNPYLLSNNPARQ